jgi:hypothetical protein
MCIKETIHNTVNTSIHITKTPTHFKSTHTHTRTPTQIHTELASEGNHVTYSDHASKHYN